MQSRPRQTCDRKSQPGSHARVVWASLLAVCFLCTFRGAWDSIATAQEKNLSRPTETESRYSNRFQPRQTVYQPPVHHVPGRRSALRQLSQETTGPVLESGPELTAPRNGPLNVEADRQLSDGFSDIQEPDERASEDSEQEGDAVPFQAIPRVAPDQFEPADSWNVPVDDSSETLSVPVPNSVSGGVTRKGGLFGPRQPPIPPDYWIISSRDCPQEKSPREADRCTKYYYRGPSGKIELRTATDFHRSLDPDIPVCFMIHGSLIEWEQNVLEGHATYEWLKRAAPNTRFQMVLFTWPSERMLLVPPIDFSVLGYRSSYNGLYLARVISRMPSSTSISLLGHSHGARLAVSALHLLGGGEAYGYRLAPRDTPLPHIRTVLAAAAMDHHWLDPGQRYGMALNGTDSLLNIKNQTDIPLILYPFPMLLGHDSLGRGGFSWLDQYRLGDNFSKVRNVDVTFLIGLGHIWPRFHDHVEIAEALTPYLFYEKDVPSHSVVTRRWRSNWKSRSAEEVRPPMIAQPYRRTSPGKSTLVRSTTPKPSRSTVERDVEIPLESRRPTPHSSTVKFYPHPAKN